jgi:membrane fusion protein (multidrug efflux system)
MRALVYAAAWLAAVTLSAGAQTPAPARVGTVIAQERPIVRGAEFVGRIEAPERVDVRARVTGYLDAVLFKEGDTVKEGAPLFRIEQDPFQAAVQQAQGALLRAQADYTNATLQAQRAEELVKTNVTSVAERVRKVAVQ